MLKKFLYFSFRIRHLPIFPRVYTGHNFLICKDCVKHDPILFLDVYEVLFSVGENGGESV